MDDITKIRKRPGMYAGDIQDGTALHNLVLGMVTFAVAQTRSRPTFDTNVILRADGAVTVCFAGSENWSDHDLGLFANARLKAGTSIIECIRLEPEALEIAGGVYCDLCVVNALSEWMCDQAWSGASIQAHMFQAGVFESIIRVPTFSDATSYGPQGLSTTFLPSERIFPSIVFDARRLQESLSSLSRQNLGTRLNLVDAR